MAVRVDISPFETGVSNPFVAWFGILYTSRRAKRSPVTVIADHAWDTFPCFEIAGSFACRGGEKQHKDIEAFSTN